MFILQAITNVKPPAVLNKVEAQIPRGPAKYHLLKFEILQRRRRGLFKISGGGIWQVQGVFD